jgi:hypothetical protein
MSVYSLYFILLHFFESWIEFLKKHKSYWEGSFEVEESFDVKISKESRGWKMESVCTNEIMGEKRCLERNFLLCIHRHR